MQTTTRLSEDTEADSSDALDESEEEIVEVKPSTQKVSREKKSPAQSR